MNITELEKKVMQGILRSEFNDGSEKSHPIWSWSIRAEGVAKKSIPGVVASLAKKGLAICDGEGKESCVCLSDEGMKMLAASAVRQPESWLSRARSVDTTTPVEIAREQRRVKARRLMRTAVDDRGKTWLMPTAKSIAMNRDPVDVEKRKASLQNFLATRLRQSEQLVHTNKVSNSTEEVSMEDLMNGTATDGIATPKPAKKAAKRGAVKKSTRGSARADGVLACRYCGSTDDIAPSFIKRRDARCRACFKQRYGSAARKDAKPAKTAKSAKTAKIAKPTKKAAKPAKEKARATA